MNKQVFIRIILVYFAVICLFVNILAQEKRTVSGFIVTVQGELVPGAEIEAETASNKFNAVSDGEGKFNLIVPNENVVLRISGKNLATQERILTVADKTDNLRIEIRYIVPKIHEELVINAETLEPSIERRNEKIYENTLFSRDDQIFQTLDAGINAGQHEGGGKSLEIRRFGFNLDHGGVNGGLKVLADNVQQNQGTQGHGQGYLGALKSLSPELVKDVEILNGPFSAEYGDFSGLGVVHIKQREELPNILTARLQGGSFNTFRTFLAYSPRIKNTASFFAYELSKTDGPFDNSLNYRRDNVTGNFTYKINEKRALGFRLNFGRNDFTSSGQLPLDEVFAGRLDRFGFLDSDNGGQVRQGTLGIYFRDENSKGRIVKVDGFVSRSLFDLYSNFTFFLNDPLNGDEIQQHDSRLQEGVNFQYLRPTQFGEIYGVFTAGGNFHANQINVGLYRTISRNPFETTTKANAKVNNYAGYIQQSLSFLDGHLNLALGLRYDFFSFDVKDRLNLDFSGSESDGKLQPKFSVSYTPSHKTPLTLHFNYGRGITSQDARGVVQQPESPKIALTDFYQAGTSYNSNRFSATFSAFLIDRSNEQVYVPDDGSIELAGPSRSYGFEAKTSIKINKYFNFNGGITQVLNAFYRGTNPRVYLDSAPKLTVNAGFTLTDWRGFSGSLRYRHINSYRLDELDKTIRAAGFDIVDLSLTKRLRKWIDFNFSVDNLTNKRYFETQNLFESRICPTCEVKERIHATPGYPITVTAGITLRFGAKN
jgi:outer membrane receptor protein involved in Fe transport